MKLYEFLLADTPALKLMLYQFRYSVYVRQMNRRQIYADHNLHTIEEPMDNTARNYILKINGEIAGAIRSNYADDITVKYYRNLYKIDRFCLENYSSVQITTKLIVRPDLHKTHVGSRMLQYYSLDSYARGVRVDVMDCNKILIDIFERCGYFSYIGWIFHREFGTVRPMFACLDALDYLRRIKSIVRPPHDLAIEDNVYGGNELIYRLSQSPNNQDLIGHYRSWKERIKESVDE